MKGKLSERNKKTSVISIRMSYELKDWLRENNIKPSQIFHSLIKDLMLQADLQ